MTTFIDVSRWQGQIDWTIAADKGVTHAYIRRTYGLSFVDSRSEGNMSLASIAGIKWGLYHYFLHHHDAEEQAYYFLSNSEPLGYLPPVLDVEGSSQKKKADSDDLLTWLGIVERERGVRPVIYTSAGYWNYQVLGGPVEWASDYKLWVAHWTTRSTPLLPKDWSEWWLWQYGRVLATPYGIRPPPHAAKLLDANRFA